MLDGGASTRREVGLIDLIADVLRIVARAMDASHFYETNRTRCSPRLDQATLQRGELGRATYRVLTGER
jgi:hypothetical protein